MWLVINIKRNIYEEILKELGGVFKVGIKRLKEENATIMHKVSTA